MITTARKVHREKITNARLRISLGCLPMRELGLELSGLGVFCISDSFRRMIGDLMTGELTKERRVFSSSLFHTGCVIYMSYLWIYAILGDFIRFLLLAFLRE